MVEPFLEGITSGLSENEWLKMFEGAHGDGASNSEELPELKQFCNPHEAK